MSPLKLDVLDVGQGDGLILWLPNGKVIVVDLGSTKNKSITGESVMKYLRDHTPFGKGKQSIEWLVLTHGDRDHYNMVEQLLLTFSPSVERALLGGPQSDYDSNFISGLRSWMAGNQPQHAAIFFGAETKWTTIYNVDGVEVEILAAGVEAGTGAYLKNTRSVVLRVQYKGRTILLTGDATVNTEQAVVKELERRWKDPKKELLSDVLKVAHHGSHRTSNSAEWIKLVNPRYAFISSDRSGSLDDGISTGHRLPQALTISLLQKYAPRLKGTATDHNYIVSFQQSDYQAYNNNPDVPGEPLAVPAHTATAQWQTRNDTFGICTTLYKMGVESDDDDTDEADKGVQWQYIVFDNGTIDLKRT